jgi:hypothetical protein
MRLPRTLGVEVTDEEWERHANPAEVVIPLDEKFFPLFRRIERYADHHATLTLREAAAGEGELHDAPLRVQRWILDRVRTLDEIGPADVHGVDTKAYSAWALASAGRKDCA